MALFWRLVLAHFAADFALQTDAVFRVKKRYSWGVLLHVAVFALASILAVIPYLNSFPLWSGLVFLWLFHVTVDKAKLALSASERRYHLGYFLLDQLLHVGAIGLVCLLLNGHLRTTPDARNSTVLIAQLKLGVAYIIAIWVSPLFSWYIRSDLLRLRARRTQQIEQGVSLPAAGRPQLPTGLWRWMGYLERGCLVAVIAQGGRPMFLIPLVLLPRAGLWMVRGRKEDVLWELVLGTAMAAAMGLWAHTP